VTAPVPLVLEDVQLAGARGARLTLTVPAHRAVAIVGDAATGIHHLAPIVLGLEAAVSGRALLLGEEVAAMPRRAALAFRRKVGYVPEGDGLLHNLSLADNVGLPLRFGTALASREVEGRLRVVLAALRLTDVAHVRPADADDEQRRRAAFARALGFDPPLVLLAQPFDRIGTATAVELLGLARGGETAGGPRRSVVVTSRALPERARVRFEERYRIAGGVLQADT
jgi:ABC-type transporter Mla maintaining outer membrane lipid asymmetry ATPase subunit MlaF